MCICLFLFCFFVFNSLVSAIFSEFVINNIIFLKKKKVNIWGIHQFTSAHNKNRRVFQMILFCFVSFRFFWSFQHTFFKHWVFFDWTEINVCLCVFRIFSFYNFWVEISPIFLLHFFLNSLKCFFSQIFKAFGFSWACAVSFIVFFSFIQFLYFILMLFWDGGVCVRSSDKLNHDSHNLDYYWYFILFFLSVTVSTQTNAIYQYTNFDLTNSWFIFKKFPCIVNQFFYLTWMCFSLCEMISNRNFNVFFFKFCLLLFLATNINNKYQMFCWTNTIVSLVNFLNDGLNLQKTIKFECFVFLFETFAIDWK